ncbi:U-box domain-containing protein 35-like [Impatiens glandulifera]|uniref:U-box domain-containing protein 35-like n=1 Tax=Impatiens glandulifera TaxID=253017 RepID=UPI001FB0D767|nr:U-box domain-containing protein 35-like [Impatiens glandulifera]
MNGNMNNRTEQHVAVAIDKDKGSQYGLKWAIDHVLTRGQTITLLHVKNRSSTITQSDNQLAKELFLPYRAFCTRKDIKSNEIIIEDIDIAKALCEYVKQNFIGMLVMGAPSKNSFVSCPFDDRFKSDIPTVVSKTAPEFCTVYIISKAKVASVRSATVPVPNPPPRPSSSSQNIMVPTTSDAQQNFLSKSAPERNHFAPRQSFEDEIRSPFDRNRMSTQSYDDFPTSDISFIGGRPSMDRLPGMSFESQESINLPRLSYSSDTDQRNSFGSPLPSGYKLSDLASNQGLSDTSMPYSGTQNMEDVEAEMRRLRQELKQTMDMYSTACKEALSAKQKAKELHRWKLEEEQRLEEARLAEEAALALAEKERAKTRAALEAAEAAQRIAELEARKRMEAETKALKESEEKKKVLDTLAQNDVRYRKYTIEEIEAATGKFSDSQKVGEGGYGPVYKCFLDHTPVAVKVLRPDAAQGRSQFQQEVEVLSCIRHPNMVLLLGACPDYGCLVYEYMANGSLEDRLLRNDKTPPLSWQMRFRIAAEIATGLLFLHQAKPEPLVHRDLKPANILLDRNFVSKISDVGLARLVPPSVADSVTQYHMTSTAGTFCYIDPEYQQTGMLGTKSDIYSLGIMLLQLITAKPPMGLTHHVERSIERGTFAEMLDQSINDWPVEEALSFAKLSLKCAELRRRDRPDLKTVILPEVNRLRALAEEQEDSMSGYNRMTTRTMMSGCGSGTGPMSASSMNQPGYETRTSQIRSNPSSYASAGDNLV